MEERNELSVKKQALFALIPLVGYAILFYGVFVIAQRRGKGKAFLYYMLCAAVLLAAVLGFVLTLLLASMPQEALIAFAVIGGAVLIWGVPYLSLAIETAFLRSGNSDKNK